MVTNKRFYYLWLILGLMFQGSNADTIKILEWNISGNELNGNITNQNAATAIFDSEDADIITLQETSNGADEIATILAANYDLAVATNGQGIWVQNSGRFVIDSTGTWVGRCNNIPLDGAMVSIKDLNSNSVSVFVYSAHFCIPDTFAGNVDTNPNVSNEDQQEHLCNIINNMEANAVLGAVIIGADFNDINIPAGESLISFLEGTGTLNGGFCSATAIDMIDVVTTDVTHIMATGSQDLFSATAAGNPSFGQHGYVVATVELASDESEAEPDPATTKGTDGNSSTAVISGRVSIDGGSDSVGTVVESDNIAITGSIMPEQDHISLIGNLYIVLEYDGQLFFKNTSDAFISWDGRLETLGVYRDDVTLLANIDIDVYSGQLLGLRGTLNIYFAYSQQDILYYNLAPISLEITQNPQGATDTATSVALSFDGVDDRVTIPYDASFPTEVFSAAAWINLEIPSRNSAIIARGEDDNSFNLSWQLYVSPEGNLITMVEDTNENNYCYPYNDCAPAGSCAVADQMVADGTWHHVAVTRSAEAVISFYIDGELRSVCENTGVPSVNNFQDMSIGATFGTIGPPPGGVEPPTWFFGGLIDDAAVWNTNLSDADVLSVYTDGVDTSSASLVGFWRFNEGENQTIIDISSRANHGYLGASTSPDSADPSWIFF